MTSCDINGSGHRSQFPNPRRRSSELDPEKHKWSPSVLPSRPSAFDVRVCVLHCRHEGRFGHRLVVVVFAPTFVRLEHLISAAGAIRPNSHSSSMKLSTGAAFRLSLLRTSREDRGRTKYPRARNRLRPSIAHFKIPESSVSKIGGQVF